MDERGSGGDTSRPLVFLSTLSAVDAYVLRALAAEHPRVHLLRLVAGADPGRAPLWQRVRAHPWRSLTGRLGDTLRAPARWRTERRLARALFGPGGVPAPETLGAAAVEVAGTWEVRTPALAQRLAALAPERMIVCGAPWLPGDLCRVPAHGTYNIHWGIVPAFRGGDSIYWALAAGRSDCIGVTIHEITPRIDAGDIVAQGRVTVGGNDDEATLWVKCAHEAAALASGLARLPADAPPATRPQGAGGRSYRYAERTLRHELGQWWRRLRGHRPAACPGRREPARLREEAHVAAAPPLP